MNSHLNKGINNVPNKQLKKVDGFEITATQEREPEKYVAVGKYNVSLLENVVNRFEQIIRIIMPNVQFTKQHVWPKVYDKYVKPHIENHNVVPDLYLQYILDMTWKDFLAEYIKEAVAISQDICAQLKRECTEIVAEDPDKSKLRDEKKKADRDNAKLRAENKQLKAVIEAEKLLRDILSGKKKISNIDAMVAQIKNAGNPIAPAKLKSEESPKVKVPENLVGKAGRKPTVKQTINQAYENSKNWEDFLTTFDENFIVQNMAEIKKFVKALYGADKIDDASLMRFNDLWNRLCPYGDYSSNVYNELVAYVENATNCEMLQN